MFACKHEDSIPCHTSPPVFTLYINKNSENYKEFINQVGEIDKSRITFYKQGSSIKKEYYTFYFDTTNPTNKNEYLCVNIPLDFTNDIYTGKTEILYLQNATKTYKIEVNGYMKDTNGCGVVAVTNEIYVDGTKIEVPYLAK